MILREATATAASVIKAISPLCVRCIAVGAVGRQHETEIKTVEIVAIPRADRLMELRAVVNNRFGPPSDGAFPSKLTKIRRPIALDLHWVSREQWGAAVFLLTGPAAYTAVAMQWWKSRHNGDGCERLFRFYRNATEEAEDTPEESDVFHLMGVPMVAPENRKVWR